MEIRIAAIVMDPAVGLLGKTLVGDHFKNVQTLNVDVLLLTPFFSFQQPQPDLVLYTLSLTYM